MSFAILGLGTALPAHQVEQQRAAEVAQTICARSAEEASMLAHLFEHAGIDTRHIVIGSAVMDDVLTGKTDTESVFLPAVSGEAGPTTRERMKVYLAEAVPLAERAAAQALARARSDPARITHLVTVSCTGFAAPGVDLGLMERLSLPRGVARTHLGFMGCHGAINGLRVAQAMAEAEPAARVLLCCVELCSIHYHYRFDLKRNVANALFADGAAAVVGAASTAVDPWQLRGTGSYLFPDSARAMTWTIGDRGFDMTLSTKVPDLIAGGLRPWLEEWLAGHGLTLQDIRSWAVHPGGPRILNAVEESLCLPRPGLDVSRQILKDHGNMSSPTVLFIVDRLRQQGAQPPCVALAFGPGLVVEAALFE
ncbi:MAG: type III polyketide synthase [Gemmataceae bacterium]